MKRLAVVAALGAILGAILGGLWKLGKKPIDWAGHLTDGPTMTGDEIRRYWVPPLAVYAVGDATREGWISTAVGPEARPLTEEILRRAFTEARDDPRPFRNPRP